jgi:hypothetical protein
MAQAILKYDLSDSDDKMEFERANKSLEMAFVLWELIYNYRKKYIRQLEADDKATERDFDLIDIIFNDVLELITEHNINIDSLIR